MSVFLYSLFSNLLVAQLYSPRQQILQVFLYAIFGIVFFGFIAYTYHSLLQRKASSGQMPFGFEARVSSIMDELSSTTLEEEDFKRISEEILKLSKTNKKHPDIWALWLRYYQQKDNIPEVMRIANEIQHSERFGIYYDSTSISELITELCEQQGDKHKAFEQILDLTMQHPKELRYLEKAASFAEQLGERDELAKLLKQITSLDPDHPEALFQIGKLFLQKKLYRSALENLQKAAKSGYNTLNPEYNYILALTLHHIGGREQPALRNYETALKNGPEHMRKSILPVLGQLYFQTQNYPAAIGALCSYFSNYSFSMDLLLLLASSYEKAFRINQASVVWEHISKQDPVNSKIQQCKEWAEEKLELYRSMKKDIAIYFYLNANKEPLAKLCQEFVQQFDNKPSIYEEQWECTDLAEGFYIKKTAGKQVLRRGLTSANSAPEPQGFMFFRHNAEIPHDFIEMLLDTLREAASQPNRFKIHMFSLEENLPALNKYVGNPQVSHIHGEHFQKLLSTMKFLGVEEVKMISPISATSSDSLTEIIQEDAQYLTSNQSEAYELDQILEIS